MTRPGASVAVAVDQCEDGLGPYTQEWHCEPPGIGRPFIAVDQSWDITNRVRKIFYWQDPQEPEVRVRGHKPPALTEDEHPRHRACTDRWPDCHSGGYDPRCCRFPKSCSCET